LKRLKIA
jgi:hypothetical protein